MARYFMFWKKWIVIIVSFQNYENIPPDAATFQQESNTQELCIGELPMFSLLPNNCCTY